MVVGCAPGVRTMTKLIGRCSCLCGSHLRRKDHAKCKHDQESCHLTIPPFFSGSKVCTQWRNRRQKSQQFRHSAYCMTRYGDEIFPCGYPEVDLAVTSIAACC